MKSFTSLVAWVTSALIGMLAVLNWSTFTSDAPLNLLVAQIEAPLGVVMLCLSGVMATAFIFAYMQNQIGSLLESRKLLKEIQKAHDLADKAEASRIEGLQKMIAKEFEQLNKKLANTNEGSGNSQP